MDVIVFDKSILNGTVISRSVPFDAPETRTIAGSVDFSNPGGEDVFAGSDLKYVLRMFASLDPRKCECVAVCEWPNSQSIQSVQWSGIARRVWLSLDCNKLVPAALILSF